MRITLSLGFSRAVKEAPDTSDLKCFPSAGTLSPGKLIPGGRGCEEEKRTLPGLLADVSELPCVATLRSTSWCRNLNLLPFREAVRRGAHVAGFPHSLRIDSPVSNCCSHGTLLHFSLQSSHLNICYYHQDLHSRRLHPGLRPRLRHQRHALLLRTPSRVACGSSVGHSLQRHPFSGLVHSAGELLHTPWRMSTSMTIVLLSR